jgi:predicted nucleotidyltransferase
MDADQPSANLLRSDTAEWKLWSLVAELANRLDPQSWVLIGGQMVALHVHLAGGAPRRTTTDVDIVADVLSDRNAFHACKAVAIGMNLEAQPSITGKNLHRFSGPAGHLDLMVPDHLPTNLTRQFTRPTPVPVAGGQRALDRRTFVHIDTEAGPASIPLPDLVGAIVIKARAATSDTRDRDRHHTDIAQLAAIIADPIELRDSLDAKEKRYLRRIRLPDDPTKSPWLELDDQSRRRAVDAWRTLVDE